LKPNDSEWNKRFNIFEGDLYRDDRPSIPLRRRYSWHHKEINSVAELKATLRAGPNTWPGCYPLYFITDDGCALSFESAQKQFRQIVWSIRNKCSDGWRIVACEVNYEDNDLQCAHSNEPIKSAYGENEVES
jgi:hypothetical protein